MNSFLGTGMQTGGKSCCRGGSVEPSADDVKRGFCCKVGPCVIRFPSTHCGRHGRGLPRTLLMHCCCCRSRTRAGSFVLRRVEKKWPSLCRFHFFECGAIMIGRKNWFLYVFCSRFPAGMFFRVGIAPLLLSGCHLRIF